MTKTKVNHGLSNAICSQKQHGVPYECNFCCRTGVINLHKFQKSGANSAGHLSTLWLFHQPCLEDGSNLGETLSNLALEDEYRSATYSHFNDNLNQNRVICRYC